MMQAERYEGPVECIRLERQRIGLGGALAVCRDGLFVPVTDLHHRRRLVDADDAAAARSLRDRPGGAAGAGRNFQGCLLTSKVQHFRELLGQVGADLRSAPVELRGMPGVVEAGLMAMTAAVMLVG